MLLREELSHVQPQHRHQLWVLLLPVQIMQNGVGLYILKAALKLHYTEKERESIKQWHVRKDKIQLREKEVDACGPLFLDAKVNRSW